MDAGTSESSHLRRKSNNFRRNVIVNTLDASYKMTIQGPHALNMKVEKGCEIQASSTTRGLKLPYCEQPQHQGEDGRLLTIDFHHYHPTPSLINT
jgi:hypothetical protein